MNMLLGLKRLHTVLYTGRETESRSSFAIQSQNNYMKETDSAAGDGRATRILLEWRQLDKTLLVVAEEPRRPGEA